MIGVAAVNVSLVRDTRGRNSVPNFEGYDQLDEKLLPRLQQI